MQGIKKYYLGIGVLSLFTIMLLVYVLIQSSSYKNDKKVNEAAVSIADELNDYIRNEQEIPENLSEVHSGDIPNEISYTKESSKRYKFCVTYSGQSGPELDAESILFTGLSGNFAQTSYDDYESDYVPRTLYLSSYGWSAGEKCYTVEPSIYQRSNSNSLYNSSDADFCDVNNEYYDIYKSYCEDGTFNNN